MGSRSALPPGNEFTVLKPENITMRGNKDLPHVQVAAKIYSTREHPNPKDPTKHYVPDSVRDEWMDQLTLLHLVVHPTVTLKEDGPSSIVPELMGERKPHDIPPFTAGAIGPRTMQLPPVEVIVDPIGMPPPIKTAAGRRTSDFL